MAKSKGFSKYSNDVKVVEVPQKFYEIFSEDEQISLINELEYKRQIKEKYTYFREGAMYWNDFYFNSPVTQAFDSLKPIIFQSILYLIGHCDSCNIIDIGPGNGYPVKDWVEELAKMEVINRYVAVDMSEGIHALIEQNFRNWFPDLEFRKYTKDIQMMEMARVFIENKIQISGTDQRLANIVLHFGNTLCNHDDRMEVFKNIHRGMDVDDLLIFDYTTDKDSNRIQHKYITGLKSLLWIPELLGIDTAKSIIETSFDPTLNAKVRYIILDKSYELIFKIFGGTKKVHLQKGDRIDIWRVYLIKREALLRELQEAGLELITLQYDSTRSTAVAVCRVRDTYNMRQ